MPDFIMLCGLPGSGKTTFCNRYKDDKDYLIVSSDLIRESFGDINDQSKNNEVFQIVHHRIKEGLKKGFNVIQDSTNLSRKRRIAFLKELGDIQCKKICVLLGTPFEFCLAQNFARERQVPEEVMCRMYKNFQMPCTYEGWDEIIIHYGREEYKTYYGDVMEYVNSLSNFNQNNSHHMLTLGDHMLKAGNHVLHLNGRVYDDVVLAAFTHDIGKSDTKSFINKNGELTTEAHYYSHHNVGAYKSLFFEYPGYVDKEHVALLIELHMRPHMEWKQSEKAKKKDQRMFGEDAIKDVELIHAADVYAK